MRAAAAGVWLVAVVALYQRDVVWRAPKFQVPLSPLVPCISILADIFLIVSLGPSAAVPFLAWTLFAAIAYALYGVHATPDSDDTGSGSGDADVELALQEVGLKAHEQGVAVASGAGPSGAPPERRGRGLSGNVSVDHGKPGPSFARSQSLAGGPISKWVRRQAGSSGAIRTSQIE